MAEGDHYRLNRREQRAGLPRMAPELRKYIQGQRVLCDWLPYEVAPETVVKVPQDLYKMLGQIGFTWSISGGYWRLKKNRRRPTDYFTYVERFRF